MTLGKHYDNSIIVWNDIVIAVRYSEIYFHMVFEDGEHFTQSHLTVQTIEPKRARLPITETGHHSFFCKHKTIMAEGGPVEYVLAWLEHEASSKKWLAYVEASRQGDLFA